jgi:MFS family permease
MTTLALRLRSGLALRSLTVSDVAPVEPTGGLFNRNFALLCQAQLVSQFGNQAFTIAMMAWTLEATRSATMSGLMVMAGVLPVIALGPIAGTFADGRRSRLRIVAGCDVLSGVLVSLLALGFVVGPAGWRPAMLFLASLLVGVCNAFFEPAVNAFAPDLVRRDQFEAANAFRQSSRQLTVLAAQGLGGILYAVLGPATLFLIDGLSFLFAGATEILIRPPAAATPSPTPAAGTGGHRSKIVDGFRYVASQPGMIGFLVTTSIFNALIVPLAILLPVYATENLGADVRWYGFLLAAISAGAIAGGMAAATRPANASGGLRRVLLVSAFALLALSLALVGQVRSREIALAIMFASGALSGLINVLCVSIVQRVTAAEFRGRVLGLHGMMTRILVPIGLVGGGALADLTGRNVPLVYGICGLLALATVTFLVTGRKTRVFLASA